MEISDNLTILVDFEDAFTSYSGIPTAILNDTLCLILAKFEVILWYSDDSKTQKILSWMDHYLEKSEKSRVRLLATRPSNFKMWLYQVTPWLIKQKIACDFSIAHLFPRLPIKGSHRSILRIYDPFGSHQNSILTLYDSLLKGDSLKNAFARMIRTYSFSTLNDSNLVKIYISEFTQRICNNIYRDKRDGDFVIFPTVQFALPALKQQPKINVTLSSPNPYFILLGGQRQRKDPLSIVKVWADNLNLCDFDLVIVGNIDESLLSQNVKDARERGRLRFMSGLSIDDLRSCIESSIGVVFNSHGEGFGFPIAEGIYLKKPVVCNYLEVFKEVGAEYPYFFESGEYDEALAILLQISRGTLGTKSNLTKSFAMSESIRMWKESLLASREQTL